MSKESKYIFLRIKHANGLQIQKKCSMLLIIGKMNIKAIMITPIRLSSVKKTEHNKVLGEDLETREHLSIVGGNVS
jgi:hypothetical protein